MFLPNFVSINPVVHSKTTHRLFIGGNRVESHQTHHDSSSGDHEYMCHILLASLPIVVEIFPVWTKAVDTMDTANHGPSPLVWLKIRLPSTPKKLSDLHVH